VGRVLVTGVLSAEGHQVVDVESGAKALEVLEQVRPDLIILDVQMPGRVIAEERRTHTQRHAPPSLGTLSVSTPAPMRRLGQRSRVGRCGRLGRSSLRRPAR